MTLHGKELTRGRVDERRVRGVLASLAVAAIALAAAMPALAQDPASGDGALEEDAVEASSTEDGTTETATTDGQLTIQASSARIRLGQRVTFTGRREPASPGSTVELRYKPSGGRFRTVGETTTDAEGRYEISAKPRRNGRFRVTSQRSAGGTLRSRRVEVGVHARIDIEAKRHQLRKRGVRVKGTVYPRDGGRRVVLQRKTPKGWYRVDRTRTDSSGAYRFRWDPPSLGGHRLRARFPGDDLNRGAREALGGPVYVYRKDHASYYGPGFYGNRTACGQILREDTVGVAHKRLPCGTVVRFHYQGRTRKIEVIDRGPYIDGRRWDLTEAARKKLNFPKGVDDIWATK